MNLLIFEPDPSGHHLQYIKTMLPSVAALADRVTLALSTDAPQTGEYQAHLPSVPPNVFVDAWIPPAPRSTLGTAKAKLIALRESVRRAQAEHVLIPYADGLAQLLGIPGVWKWCVPRGVHVEILMFRGSFAYPQPSRKRLLKHQFSWWLAMRPPWHRLHLLDPLVYERMRVGHARHVLSLMPDPVEPPSQTPRQQILMRLGLPTDGCYVGMAGLLHPGKGVEPLARAFAKAQLPPGCRLLLVGKQHPDVRQMLQAETGELVRDGRIVMIDRVVNAADLADAIAAMDLVCVPYFRHVGSSSIVVRAAAAGRPVLASDYGWCGSIVPQFDLGWTTDMSNAHTLPQAIASALNRVGQYTPSEAAKRFARFHTPENFAVAWSHGLRQRLALPLDEQEPQSWEEVTGE